MNAILKYGAEKRYYSTEKALGIVFELNSEEQDDWRYVAKECEHDNLSYIEIYDEENEFVAYWSL